LSRARIQKAIKKTKSKPNLDWVLEIIKVAEDVYHQKWGHQ
jgi:hypothetical protein